MKNTSKSTLSLAAAVAAAFTLAPAAQAQWAESVFVNPGTANTNMGTWDIDVSNGIGIAAPNAGAPDDPILFNTSDGTLLRRLNPTTALSANVMGAAIDGNRAVVGKQNSHFALFDVATGNEIGSVASTAGNGFGSSAAISGNLVAIGGWGGNVEVFDVSTPSAIVSLGTVPSSGNFAFALSGNTLVSAYFGTVNVYTVGATSIGTGTQLTAPGTAGNFGTSVDIDGDMVIVGATGDYAGTTNAGSAYLFDLSVSYTVAQATITPSGPEVEQRRFGYDVGISGDTVIVASGMRYAGTSQYSEDGEAYLFDITNPAAITQIQKMGTGVTVGDDRFGYEGGVAIDGDVAVVSASSYDIPSGNSNVGAAYIYLGTIGTKFCSANANSTGLPSSITAQGSLQIVDNDFTLHADSLPVQPGIFFYGPTQGQVPFGNGFLCVSGGVTLLYPVAVAAGGAAQHTIDLVAAGMAPGTFNFQYWYRDPLAGGAYFNSSDGLEIVFVP